LEITLVNPFWVTMENMYAAAATQLGVKIDVYAAPSEGDTTSQLNTLETMVSKDYKAIIFTPIDPENLIPGIVMGNKKGIYMVDSGPEVDTTALAAAGGHLDGWLSVDFTTQGTLAAQEIVKELGSAGGKVAIIEGIPGAGQSDERVQGATTVFQASPNITLLAPQPGNWDATTAYNIATNLIEANPDLKAIYCCNDDMGVAAASALAAAGHPGVLVFGADFTPAAQSGIEAGTYTGTTTFSEAAWAEGTVIDALKLIQGLKDLPTGMISEPIMLITKANVAQFSGFE
jgi:ABC-type sugar transport system substrate-binding protein